MANTNAPYGLQPIGTFNGSPYNGRTTRYFIPSSDGNALYIGDCVKSSAGADANGVPQVVKITNGTDTIRGVVVGISPEIGPFLAGQVPDLSKDPWITAGQVSIPATKLRDYYVEVVDDPEAMFIMQGDATATNQVAANVNKNASYTVTAPSPATNPVSASVINSGSIATTQGLNLRLVGLLQVPNNAFGAFAQWVVKINQHELMGNTVGI
jgi:hypothetical protein